MPRPLATTTSPLLQVAPLAWPQHERAWTHDRREFTALNESRE